MENHINKLSPKILSLHGKVTLLNTLILSKTTYLINIFPLDGITTSRIHKNKFQYIWNIQKLESIARKTISLKKKTRGGRGLNLIEPEAHNYAMRIKHLLTLKQNFNPPP